MRKKLLLTVAVLSVLGIHSSVQALSFEDAKAIFDTPVSNNNDPVSDLDTGNNSRQPELLAIQVKNYVVKGSQTTLRKVQIQ